MKKKKKESQSKTRKVVLKDTDGIYHLEIELPTDLEIITNSRDHCDYKITIRRKQQQDRKSNRKIKVYVYYGLITVRGITTSREEAQKGDHYLEFEIEIEETECSYLLRRLFQYVGTGGFYNVGGYFDEDLYLAVKKYLGIE